MRFDKYRRVCQRCRSKQERAARNTWVTETVLSTALNVTYFATGVSIFSIVVGVAADPLVGVGFALLAAAVFRRSRPDAMPT